MIEILAATSNGAVSRANLDAWVQTYRLPVTVLRDPSGTPTLRSYGIRESTFIVETATATIVEKYNGRVDGVGPSGVAQALPRMLSLLRGM